MAGGGPCVTAVTLVTAAVEDGGSLNIKLLSDLKTVFGDRLQMLTVEILEALNGMVESPWGDLKGKPLDARQLAYRLGKYEVKRRTIRIGEVVGKGYKREDLHDPWSRYVTDGGDGIEVETDPLPPSSMDGVTSVAAVTADPSLWESLEADAIGDGAP